MRIIFVEFEWQAIKIVSDKKFLKSDIIISLDSTSSYIFKKKKLNFLKVQNFVIVMNYGMILKKLGNTH